ncbi:MAG TPA: carbohydrate binding domain-containing protein [Pyrinomonadaceae bacterium]|nr:carbohydrate binding domain-containing protein [Pyrinomonadaceae bacterium]
MRSAIALLAIACCLFAMQAAARVGFTRLLGKYAVVTNSIPAAEYAVALAPSDPEVHRARARVMNRLRIPIEARKSFETASSLRYRDDYLWLELGATRDELGDTPAALAAFDQAVRWAPYYAHTHWQRGNLRLRAGQYNEALEDLRAATASRKSLLPNFIDLAWGLARGDVKTVEQLIQLDGDQDRLAFARFLATKGKGEECVAHVRLLGTPLSEQNRSELVEQLIRAKAFRHAFELWRTDNSLKPPVILNGGFEEPVSLAQRVFGWNIFPKTEAGVSADRVQKASGQHSLRINFGGEWKAIGDVISQRIIVEPQKRYRISFAVRTKDLVTGAPPIFAVSDAGDNTRLGQSEAFPTPSSDWQTIRFEFSTTPSTQAILLDFTKVEAACTPCPIYGELWLDDFLIEDVTTTNSQR